MGSDIKVAELRVATQFYLGRGGRAVPQVALALPGVILVQDSYFSPSGAYREDRAYFGLRAWTL